MEQVFPVRFYIDKGDTRRGVEVRPTRAIAQTFNQNCGVGGEYGIHLPPRDYGLINVNDACQPVFSGIKPACSTPDRYYFWDEIHPTRRVHQIIGEDMAKFVVSQQVKAVPEPSTVLGSLFALGAIGITKRKRI